LPWPLISGLAADVPCGDRAWLREYRQPQRWPWSTGTRFPTR